MRYREAHTSAHIHSNHNSKMRSVCSRSRSRSMVQLVCAQRRECACRCIRVCIRFARSVCVCVRRAIDGSTHTNAAFMRRVRQTVDDSRPRTRAPLERWSASWGFQLENCREFVWVRIVSRSLARVRLIYMYIHL